jgi:hypothetical protein
MRLAHDEQVSRKATRTRVVQAAPFHKARRRHVREGLAKAGRREPQAQGKPRAGNLTAKETRQGSERAFPSQW